MLQSKISVWEPSFLYWPSQWKLTVDKPDIPGNSCTGLCWFQSVKCVDFLWHLFWMRLLKFHPLLGMCFKSLKKLKNKNKKKKTNKICVACISRWRNCFKSVGWNWIDHMQKPEPLFLPRYSTLFRDEVLKSWWLDGPMLGYNFTKSHNGFWKCRLWRKADAPLHSFPLLYNQGPHWNLLQPRIQQHQRKTTSVAFKWQLPIK